MPVWVEQDRVHALFSRVGQIEDVADTLPVGDPRRRVLNVVVCQELSAADPVRPVIAAGLLGLTEKTVRAWVRQGVLTAGTERPRLLLDAARLHEVLRVVGELRAAGRSRGLLGEVYHRLADAALLERADLRASVEQMRRGQGRVVRGVVGLPRRDAAVEQEFGQQVRAAVGGRYPVLVASVMADQLAAAVWLLPAGAAGALTRQAVRAAADPGWNPSTGVCRTLCEQLHTAFM